MPEALILEFDGLGLDTYNTVNRLLEIEPGSTDNLPEGLLLHAGAAKDGGLVVFEVWSSRDAQDAFMSGRLGAALQSAGVTGPPTRMEWLELGGYASA